MQIAMRLSGLLLSLSATLFAVPSAADDAADSAIYWALSRDGEPAGFLLGTIHSEDPRVLDRRARETLGMSRDQEVIIFFEQDPDATDR